jgi:thiosulfate dehydrogenase
MLAIFSNRRVTAAVVLTVALLWIGCGNDSNEKNVKQTPLGKSSDSIPWRGAASTQIPVYSAENGKDIWYGYELISKTAYYLGPNGTVNQISNGMNCQNCHLDAGTKPFGNNYGAVASTYPKFRERSGTMESIEKRVNDCFERSLNGKALDNNSLEMKAIVAYISWLGRKVAKGDKPYGSGIMEIKYLNRAADPEKGKVVFEGHCARCHGDDGQGLKSPDGKGYEFPPLWGPHSYNEGAGLYRLSRFAGYVYNNMPNTVNWHNPEITQEQAWDVAAFVNSQPRPKKDLSKDWPNISGKPVDHPFGPYADSFSEKQHKYGPYGPIAEWKKEHAAKKASK